MTAQRLIAAAVVACAAIVATIVLRPSQDSNAAFHDAEISEVMFGTTGDASLQYVEINMLSGGQNVTGNTRLSAWNADGSFFGVLLLVPANVSNSGTNVKWIMATSSFAADAGITPDFTFTQASLPATGMICWGAPGVIPPNPGTWDASLASNYVDCVPYGGYTAANIRFGPATSAPPGDGEMSLTRTSHTDNTSADFELLCPTPRNNAGQTGTIGDCGQPTATPTPTLTATPTATATATPCIAPDPDSDGLCDALDNCPADNNPAQTNSDSGPPPPPGRIGVIDNGPGVAASDVTLPDDDFIGDICDPDLDNDALPNAEDVNPLTASGVCAAFVGSSDGHVNPASGDNTNDDDGDGTPVPDAGDSGPSWDTDNDGVRDGVECMLGANPRFGASKPSVSACGGTADADSDGLTAASETCKWGTSDAQLDSDGDAIKDCVEANDTNGDKVQNFPGDTIASARAANALIGRTMDFDVNGDGAVNFPGDTILSARMANHVGGIC